MSAPEHKLLIAEFGIKLISERLWDDEEGASTADPLKACHAATLLDHFVRLIAEGSNEFQEQAAKVEREQAAKTAAEVVQ